MHRRLLFSRRPLRRKGARYLWAGAAAYRAGQTTVSYWRRRGGRVLPAGALARSGVAATADPSRCWVRIAHANWLTTITTTPIPKMTFRTIVRVTWLSFVGWNRLLEMIASNLLSNAIHYTPAGGRVELRLHQYHDTLVLSVRDNGIGISAQHQKRIF